MIEHQLPSGHVLLVDDDDAWVLYAHAWFANVQARPNRIPYIQVKAYQTEKDGKKTTIFVGRLLLDAQKGEIVDHINHNPLDNRRCNIRICTHRENNQNRRSQQTTRKRYRGIFWRAHRGKWDVQIVVNGRRCFFGGYVNEEDAARAYDTAAFAAFGEFAVLNFPTPSAGTELSDAV